MERPCEGEWLSPQSPLGSPWRREQGGQWQAIYGALADLFVLKTLTSEMKVSNAVATRGSIQRQCHDIHALQSPRFRYTYLPCHFAFSPARGHDSVRPPQGWRPVLNGGLPSRSQPSHQCDFSLTIAQIAHEFLLCGPQCLTAELIAVELGRW